MQLCSSQLPVNSSRTVADPFHEVIKLLGSILQLILECLSEGLSCCSLPSSQVVSAAALQCTGHALGQISAWEQVEA